MNERLTGKTAVVSGGSRGIGRAIAARLAEEACDVLLAARSPDDLEAAAASISAATGRRIEICPADLTTLDGCRQVVDAATAGFGGVDILVNCAGDTRPGPFLDLDDDIWQAGFALKLFSAVRLSRMLWPSLKERSGTVINIVGGMARNPDPGFMVGGAVNAALANFSKALAGLGLQDDVNVNTIHPGMTKTERMEMILDARAVANNTTRAEAERSAIERQGIRRLGEPEDVAALAVFLCTPEARHITGVSVSVDGGATRGLF